MIKKLTLLAIAGGMLVTSFSASATPVADSPFPPKSESLDNIVIAMQENERPFPWGSESIDNRIDVAMDNSDSPFPKGESNDLSVGSVA